MCLGAAQAVRRGQSFAIPKFCARSAGALTGLTMAADARAVPWGEQQLAGAFSSATGTLSVLQSRGDECLMRGAAAQAQDVFMNSMSDESKAAALAGGLVRNEVGANAFFYLIGDGTLSSVPTQGGQRDPAVQIQPESARQALSFTRLQTYHSYLPGAGAAGLTISGYAIERIVFIQDALHRVTGVLVTQRDLFPEGPRQLAVEVYADAIGLQWQRLNTRLQRVDPRAAALLAAQHGAHNVSVVGAPRVSEVVHLLSAVAGGQAIITQGGATAMQAGRLADFAAGLLGVGSSFALPTAVGIWAEGGAAATQAGLDVVPNLVHLLEAGMVELYSTLGSHLWKGVLHDAIANEINGVAPHLRPTAARMAGTAFRRTVEKLVAPSPAPAPAPTSQQVPLGMPAPAGQAPLGMPIGASAPAPTIPGLSPDSQREHAALSQRMAVLQQRALGVQPSLT